MRVFALKEPTLNKWQPGIVTRILQSSSMLLTYCVRFTKNFEFKRFTSIALNDTREAHTDDDDDDDEYVELKPTCVAYSEPVDHNCTIPIQARIVTLYQNENDNKSPYFSVGTICETPNAKNHNRYLVFFDDGYAQYIRNNEAFLLFESKKMDVNKMDEGHLDFLNDYFEQYPNRPLIPLYKDNILSAFYMNKWQTTRVVDVDGSLVRLCFLETNHYEWLHRGSYRLFPFFEKHKQLKQRIKSTASMDENQEPFERCLMKGT
jgi:hypothetical protein